MSKLYTALGLMSGTSMDGVDAALIRTDGESVEVTPHFRTFPYTHDFQAKLRELVRLKQDAPPAMIAEIEAELTEIHADVVEKFLDNIPEKPDIIGFHGHTIDHRPDEGETWQIGSGKLLAQLTGIDVVNDFRTADVKAGGQGAPLVPLYHAALFHKHPKPLAVLNIGGVANITYIDDEPIIAFDTGPGNALLDDWMLKNTGNPIDEDGKTALSGRADQKLLNRWLTDPYFIKLSPKSLDRDHFMELCVVEGDIPNGAATLAAFTAATIEKGSHLLPYAPQQWYVCGGGRLNKAIMQYLDEYLKAPVQPIEDAGYNGDAIEAQAFGFLAVRSLLKLPLSLPTTTGIKKSSATGGVFYLAVPARAS